MGFSATEITRAYYQPHTKSQRRTPVEYARGIGT
jgi:hypothetical protein